MLEQKDKAFVDWLKSDSYVIFIHDLKGITEVTDELLEFFPKFAFDAGWEAGVENTQKTPDYI